MANSAAWAEAKRVLIVHSFGRATPPFATQSTAFQTTLTKELGESVDMDEVSLDMASYGQPDLEGRSSSSCSRAYRNGNPTS